MAARYITMVSVPAGGVTLPDTLPVREVVASVWRGLWLFSANIMS
jgi:hypothetical protein